MLRAPDPDVSVTLIFDKILLVGISF